VDTVAPTAREHRAAEGCFKRRRRKFEAHGGQEAGSDAAYEETGFRLATGLQIQRIEVTLSFGLLESGEHSRVSACLLQALSWGIHLGCDESIRLSPYRALYDIPARTVDRSKLEGPVNLMGESGRGFSAEQGARVMAERATRTDLATDPTLPAETRLWAAVQKLSGGPWGGCVFDVDSILKVRAAGKRAIEEQQDSA
jgi:hypothetical protein